VHRDIPVVTDADPGRFAHQRWGLIPEWADDASTDPINARAETLTEKPSFAGAVEHRRCLVPAWGSTSGSTERTASIPTGWRSRTAARSPWPESGRGGSQRRDRPGWVSTRAAARRASHSFAVVTTEPNDPVADFHHRMAVVLDPGEESTWLHESVDEALDCCEPYPLDALTVHPRLDASDQSAKRKIRRWSSTRDVYRNARF